MTEQKTIIEINGVKMEIDMRHAKIARVDTLTIGTRVKVLKKGYGDDYNVYGGIVVGFDAFERLPSIRIAYIKSGYGETPLDFIVFNATSKDIEILIDDDTDDLGMNRDSALQSMDRAIESKRMELQKAIQSREFFLKHFGKALQLAEEASSGQWPHASQEATQPDEQAGSANQE